MELTFTSMLWYVYISKAILRRKRASQRTICDQIFLLSFCLQHRMFYYMYLHIYKSDVSEVVKDKWQSRRQVPTDIRNVRILIEYFGRYVYTYWSDGITDISQNERDFYFYVITWTPFTYTIQYTCVSSFLEFLWVQLARVYFLSRYISVQVSMLLRAVE